MAQINQITENHQEFHSYITLAELTLPEIPEKLDFEGYELHRKIEFHISLVWGEKIAELIDKSRQDQIVKEIIDDFLRFNNEKPVTEYKLLPEFRFLERGKQKTIIVMAKVKHLNEFFELLRKKYNKQIPLQPTHLTLYTLPPDKIGVGIFDEKQLIEQTKVIDAPKLKEKLFSQGSK